MSDRGYKCPSCGMAATSVIQTSTLSSCIVRNRKCLYCGHTHETGEFPMNLSSAMLEAVSVLAENAIMKAADLAGR